MDLRLQNDFACRLDMWQQHILHVGDFAHFIERSIVEYADADIFMLLPDEVKKVIRTDLDDFNLLKFRTVAISQTSTVLDLTNQMERLTQIMCERGFWQPGSS